VSGDEFDLELKSAGERRALTLLRREIWMLNANAAAPPDPQLLAFFETLKIPGKLAIRVR
jgi:hypothetical protein